MPAASGTCPATPYTVAVHSLHGPVARVDTRVYDPSESNGDDRLISRDYKVYNRRGQLTAESITTDDYEGDTLRLDYDDTGRLVIDVDPSVVAVYDGEGRLIRVENYDNPHDRNADPSMVTFFEYDRFGRLISESVATGDGGSIGGEWLTIDEYEYGPKGLIRVLRDDAEGRQSVMELDDTGAPVYEDTYDVDGNRIRHSDYKVTSRDRCGNWTDASVTTDHRRGDRVVRHIVRTIEYYR